MRKIITGNDQALRILIERYKHHVFKITYSVVHDQQEAEDLAQDTFIKMVDALPSYQFQGFKTWLSRIALHKAIDFKRKKARRREELTIAEHEFHLSIGESSEDVLLKKEKVDLIRQSVQQMPEKLQLTVKCFYLEGLSYTQIAERLEIEEKTVEMRLYRARKWLKSKWKEEDM
ncbi:sigma-70 family RNA polymerase sigma factor [Aquibacillus sp. LR5S19]|uniref:Sigma-70 family RNA polymerase sigma factor n=1 Tax=Aquibacillus rhizosphaerae TaxID=3051431 RepID=A0ABT7LCF9_9BACI|nr:sigma-70 family RNA polymerase sigma factor [Aquibacillus sp. LR5S19]MDL4842275.1 sigma-70 family RNA polymerase sigma factor [Aquibacillus sp. LR5S19]